MCLSCCWCYALSCAFRLVSANDGYYLKQYKYLPRPFAYPPILPFMSRSLSLLSAGTSFFPRPSQCLVQAKALYCWYRSAGYGYGSRERMAGLHSALSSYHLFSRGLCDCSTWHTRMRVYLYWGECILIAVPHTHEHFMCLQQ